MKNSFFDIHKDNVHLHVKVTPNSSNNKILGIYPDGFFSYLKISIKAPPEKGKANKELCEFLSNILQIPISSISVEKGSTSQKKLVLIKNCDHSITNLSNIITKIQSEK